MKGQFVRQLAVLGAAFVMAGSVTIVAAPGSASAAILPTTTSVSVNPTPVYFGPSPTATATATVGPLDLLITPSGTVTWRLYVPAGPITATTQFATLGTTPLTKFCVILLKACTATYTFTASFIDGMKGPGPLGVEAIYSGDALSGPSSGIGTLDIEVPPAT
jgi:hypothetical protein